MFDLRRLRSTVIIATIAMLMAEDVWASKNERDGLTMEFVRIPAGSFYMGSPSSEKDRDDSEGLVHEVRITKPFYMGRYELTQTQWKAVMGTTLSQQRDKAESPWLLKGEGPEHPMYYVSWEEAVEFCKRLGRGFRLPTEAEWEYACRAGTQTRFYYGDDPNYSELDQHAWYYGKSDNMTHPVGQKKPNAWGLYDMHGNVDEWCSDQYEILRNYENTKNLDRPVSASTRYPMRACRGGSWFEKPNRCRSANRGGAGEDTRFDFGGFRIIYSGQDGDNKDVLQIALPEKPLPVAAAPDKKSASRPQAVAGVVRDEEGLPISDVEMRILPTQGLRQYAEGKFEIRWYPADPNARMRRYHLVARHEKRNLAVAVEIKEDANALDIRLKPGVIIAGQAVDPEGKGVEGATVIIRDLQTSDWSSFYLEWLKTDVDGRFEFRALPPGYDYVLSARKMHYGVGQTEIRSEDVRDNRVQGISVVLPRGEFSVSGIVVDAKGKAVPDVWVFCTGRGQAGINCETDAEGHFKADGIFKGQVNIIASIQGNDGQWLGGSISVEAGATNVKIVLGSSGVPPPKGRTCFPADTKVWMDGELVEISKVSSGQTVAKSNSAWTVVPFGQVEEVEEHLGVFECRDIMFENGNRIGVVDAHCFMLDSGRWIAAQSLKKGLKLKTLDGTVTIKSVTVRATPYVGKVCNLKIKKSDSYMVGMDGVIVRDY